ncbi:MAG TPA: hypothetical protein EYG06_10075 [Myxococcales bacterium]|nr:hypothetical protein [Myxococcales bacterium]
MEFIAGFAWPVPRAMAGAVSACRFEQGDVVYSQTKGYEGWPKGRRGLKFALQVLDPPKSARALGPEAAGNRFEANWNSAVELELIDYAEAKAKAKAKAKANTEAEAPAERRITTQGRLFCCLWHGDPAWLDPSGREPAPPVPQRDLHRRLEATQPTFTKCFKERCSRSPVGGAFARGFSLYLAAVDDANESVRSKAKAVEAVLAEKFEVESLWLSPAEAGLADAEALHPALRIQGLAVAAQKPEAIEALLRGLLYGGAGESGRFSLARHGLLAAVAPD